MKNPQVLTLISETGKKVEEEKYLIGTEEDVEVSVKYTYEFSNATPPAHVVYQIFEGAKHTSGTFVGGGLNVTNFNADYIELYAAIEATCVALVNPE